MWTEGINSLEEMCAGIVRYSELDEVDIKRSVTCLLDEDNVCAFVPTTCTHVDCRDCWASDSNHEERREHLINLFREEV